MQPDQKKKWTVKDSWGSTLLNLLGKLMEESSLEYRTLLPPDHPPSTLSSVAQLCPTLCDPMDCSTPGLPVQPTYSRSVLKLTSIDSVMPSNHLILCGPLLLLAFNLSRHQGLFQWVSSSHQVARVLEFSADGSQPLAGVQTHSGSVLSYTHDYYLH